MFPVSQRPLFARGLGLSVLVAAFLLVAAPAQAQHTPCNPGDFYKNSCVPNTVAAPGASVVVPIAQICPKDNISPIWLTVACTPPASCTTIRHSTKIVTLCLPGRTGTAADGDTDLPDEEPIPCGDEIPEGFSQTFVGDDVISHFDSPVDSPTSFLYTTTAGSMLQPGEHTYDFETSLTSVALQMLENTSDQATELSGELTFEEGLNLKAGERDEDRFLNLSSATVHLTNDGMESAKLILVVSRRALPDSIAGYVDTGVGGIALTADWDSAEPSMASFALFAELPGESRTELAGPTFENLRANSFLHVDLEPGESWQHHIEATSDANDLQIAVHNRSHYDAYITKTVAVERSGVLEPGERKYLVCAGAGSMLDLMTTSDGPVRNTMATALLVHDLEPGVEVVARTMGFEDVTIDTRPMAGRTVRKRIWCWSETVVGTFTIHYDPGSTITLDTRINVPAGAPSGSTFSRWYTVTAQSAGMIVTNMCHPTVTVP